MESEVLKKFNNELSTLNDGKNLSKTKIQDITKAAIKAKASYKNVVFNIERLMAKSKPEQRISALYVIDSIIRASKHQLKEKDVYGPRFIKLFDRILGHMLKCGHREKYKTIRTMNLWLSNKVFAEKDIQPFRERCKKAGLAIEFEQVERAVKGSNADMSIYSGAYKKKEKTSRRSKASHDDGLLGAGPSSTLPLPDIPTFALSEEILDGTISEREMMELVQKFGIDRGGLLAKNRDLLQKTLKVFVATLLPRIAEAQSGNKKNDGNSIQNVLTKDFEYSDDEEEKEKDVREEEKKKLTHDEVLELAQNLLNMPTVVAQLHEVLNPVALAPIMPQIKEEIPTSLGAFSAGPPPNLLGIPQLPGFPGLTGLSTAEMLRVQNTQNMILQQRAAQALLQTVPVSGQHNLLLLGNQLMNPFGIPTGINPLLSPPNQDLAQQQQMLLNGTEQKMEVEVNSEEVAKQKQKESRERRKMGLPSIKAGKTIVASRTLWLKKIPTNVTENELKQAVETCGEATRVKIIGNRACAFVTMDTRRAANEVIQKLREVTVAKKQVKVYWARSPGMDSDVYTEMWEADRGVLEIPYEKLPSDLVPLCEGAVLDVDSLPEGKRGAYNEKGEGVKQANPAPPPPVPQPPPPLGFPFPVGLGQLPPGFNGGKPAPPGMHPLLNMTVPPPPGMPTFPPAPPPPGVGPPTGGPPLGFDPNKPPPMFPPRFGPPGVPPPGGPPFGRGNGAMPPFGRGGGPPPMGFRGRGGGPPPPHHFDARRGVMMPRPEMNMHRPEGRGRLLDQSEMWKMISSRERERSGQGDRRRRDDNPRRRSRWEEDDRNGSPRHGSPRHGSPRNGSPRNGSPRNGSPRYRRRSPERRPRRSPSNEQFGEPEVKRINADENEIVSSTTLDELNAKGALPAEVVVPKVDEDKTDDVPMDLE